MLVRARGLIHNIAASTINRCSSCGKPLSVPMNASTLNLIFKGLISLTLFSLWAAFALLFINGQYHETLPGYTIGRLCIWELVALVAAIALANWLSQRWGGIVLQEEKGQRWLRISPKFGWYFLAYFLLALIIAAWQFWRFSQQF